MYQYKFFCKKCGHYSEWPTKDEVRAEKKSHKKEGCKLEHTPHKNDFLLVRPSLAEAARIGKDMMLTHELSLEIQDSENTEECTDSE